MVNIKIYLRSNTNQSFLVDQTIFSRFRDGKILFSKWDLNHKVAWTIHQEIRKKLRNMHVHYWPKPYVAIFVPSVRSFKENNLIFNRILKDEISSSLTLTYAMRALCWFEIEIFLLFLR